MQESLHGGDASEYTRTIKPNDAQAFPASETPSGETAGYVDFFKHVPFWANGLKIPRRIDIDYLQSISGNSPVIIPGKSPSGSTTSGGKVLNIKEIDYGVLRNEDGQADALYDPVVWSNWHRDIGANLYQEIMNFKKVSGTVARLQGNVIVCQGDTKTITFRNNGFRGGEEYVDQTNEASFPTGLTCENASNATKSRYYTYSFTGGGNIVGRHDATAQSPETGFILSEQTAKAMPYDIIIVYPLVNGVPYVDTRNVFMVKHAYSMAYSGSDLSSVFPVYNYFSVNGGATESASTTPQGWSLYIENTKLDGLTLFSFNGGELSPFDNILFTSSGATNPSRGIQAGDTFDVCAYGKAVPGTIRVFDMGYPGRVNSKGGTGKTELELGVDFTVGLYGPLNGEVVFTQSYKDAWKTNLFSLSRTSHTLSQSASGLVITLPVQLSTALLPDVYCEVNGLPCADLSFNPASPYDITVTRDLQAGDLVMVQYPVIYPVCFAVEYTPVQGELSDIATFLDESNGVIPTTAWVDCGGFLSESVSFKVIRFPKIEEWNTGEDNKGTGNLYHFESPHPYAPKSGAFNIANGWEQRNLYVTTDYSGNGHRCDSPITDTIMFDCLPTRDSFGGHVFYPKPSSPLNNFYRYYYENPDRLMQVVARVKVSNISYSKGSNILSYPGTIRYLDRGLLYWPSGTPIYSALSTPLTAQSDALSGIMSIQCRATHIQYEDSNCMNMGDTGGCRISSLSKCMCATSGFEIRSNCKYRTGSVLSLPGFPSSVYWYSVDATHARSVRDACTGAPLTGYIYTAVNNYCVVGDAKYNWGAEHFDTNPELFNPKDYLKTKAEVEALYPDRTIYSNSSNGLVLSDYGSCTVGSMDSRVVSRWRSLLDDGEGTNFGGPVISSTAITHDPEYIDIDITDTVKWMYDNWSDFPYFGLFFNVVIGGNTPLTNPTNMGPAIEASLYDVVGVDQAAPMVHGTYYSHDATIELQQVMMYVNLDGITSDVQEIWAF